MPNIRVTAVVFMGVLLRKGTNTLEIIFTPRGLV